MSLAKRCDICGSYYEPYNIANSRSEAENRNNGFAFISLSKDGEKFFTARVTDCCPICLGSIKDRVEQLKRS